MPITAHPLDGGGRWPGPHPPGSLGLSPTAHLPQDGVFLVLRCPTPRLGSSENAGAPPRGAFPSWARCGASPDTWAWPAGTAPCKGRLQLLPSTRPAAAGILLCLCVHSVPSLLPGPPWACGGQLGHAVTRPLLQAELGLRVSLLHLLTHCHWTGQFPVSIPLSGVWGETACGARWQLPLTF